MCFGHEWVWLGHVTVTRMTHIQNDYQQISVFQVYLHKYGFYHKYFWNFITNMEYSCQIAGCTSITAGRKASQ